VAYRVAEHEKGDLVYEVDHASSLFVLNPSGERIGLFSAPHDIKAITADLITLLEKS
jgi:cytochrome oxidase Cu insertion factor (SCO1/SenC/PrrC family)